jgi:electron transport complex protein RnfB
MPDEVYRQLAQRLDAVPNGFPATESGAELRLLAKIFSPEEAALAGVMRLNFEPAADIAARAGADRDTAYRTLKQMARKGLVYAGKGKGRLAFALMPFIVGFYEQQLPYMDAELAALFEQYYQETQGGVIVREAPSVHRVIPVEEAVAVDVEVYPFERASEMLQGAKAWGVRNCICRVQQRLIGAGCEHPIENCLVFAPVEGVFAHDKLTRAITREEALRILREAEEAGLVHTAGNFRDQHFYICNCCTCSCGILRSLAEFGVQHAVAHSDFRATVDAELCIGCGDCVERCQFGALSLPEEVCVVDDSHCVGCGLCASVCPTEALQLARRPRGEAPPMPVDEHDWMAQRARARGISLTDVLD